jgi:transposase
MRSNYENEFKTTIVELLKSGKKVSEVSQEYNLSEGMIRRWHREYDQKSGDLSKKRDLSSTEIELRQLRKQLRETKLERDILKKAVGIFSKSDS